MSMHRVSSFCTSDREGILVSVMSTEQDLVLWDVQ